MVWPEPMGEGSGDYQDLLGVDNEPALIVYTPDIECYCDTEENARAIIDEWVLEHGSAEEYRFKADMRLGWNRLEVV